jgi:hypothetical protein
MKTVLRWARWRIHNSQLCRWYSNYLFDSGKSSISKAYLCTWKRINTDRAFWLLSMACSFLLRFAFLKSLNQSSEWISQQNELSCREVASYHTSFIEELVHCVMRESISVSLFVRFQCLENTAHLWLPSSAATAAWDVKAASDPDSALLPMPDSASESDSRFPKVSDFRVFAFCFSGGEMRSEPSSMNVEKVPVKNWNAFSQVECA